MNTNLLFVFLFIFLVILLTMYQLRLNSSITCLLTIITILLLFKLIKQKEYFSNQEVEVMINLISNMINILEVKKTTAATNLDEEIIITTQAIIPQNEMSEKEKKSFLGILIEIRDNLKKQLN